MDKQQRQQMEKISQQAFILAGIQMQTIFNRQKTSLNEWDALVGLLYLQYAVNGLLVIKAAQKQALLRQIDEKLKIMYKDLGVSEVNEVSDILENGYKSTFENLGTYLKGTDIPLTAEEIEKAVNTSIDGELYSERIWKNKDKLIKLLRKSIADILQGDMTIDEATKQIQKVFNVSAYDSKRLIDSEMTRVMAQVSTNLCNDLGIETQIWSSTFENSCKECIALDGKKFEVGKGPQPPVHSNCACLRLPNI